MKFYNFTYFLKEGIQSIFAHRLMSFAAMGVIMACLLLMGSFSLVAANIDYLLDDVESKNEVVAYVDETLSEEDARKIESEILGVSYVSEAKFVSKQEALDIFRAEFGEQSSVLDGLDEDNPLRDRYEIKLYDLRDTADAAEALEGVSGVAKVSARSDISDKIIQVRDVVSAICIVLILILIAISIFIISNTVNLTMFNRREEIAIMKMIGATNSFVRIPFVIEGLLLGIVGAGIALLLQWGVYEYLVASVLEGISFIPVVSFTDVWLGLAGAFFGVGILVGGLGSAMTIRKFLKV